MISRSLVVVIFLMFCSASTFSAESQYQASMAGIECNGCKKTISQSIGRIKGVKTIRISKTGEKSHRMTVTTDGTKALSRSDVVRAMGKNAPHYKIVSWSKVK